MKVSHICIFPSDGANRIRFTGQSAAAAQSQPETSGPPKTYLFCDSAFIIDTENADVKHISIDCSGAAAPKGSLV